MSLDPYTTIHNNLQCDKRLIDSLAFQFRKTAHRWARQPLLYLLFSYLSIDRQLSRSITITVTCTLISATNIFNCFLWITLRLLQVQIVNQDISTQTGDCNVYKKPSSSDRQQQNKVKECTQSANRERGISSCFNCKCSCLCKHAG